MDIVMNKQEIDKCNRGKFFVLSGGDSPDQIVFSFNNAVSTKADYIDIFDENGCKSISLKFVCIGEDNIYVYTTDF